MSQENVEIVRHGYESLKRRDFVAAFERVSPDFELDLSSLYPDAPVLRGADELMRWVYSGPWGGSVRLEPERLFDVDAERVLVFVRVTAMGEGSGVPVELRDAHELTISEGLLMRCKVHPDRDAALEALGLSEQDAHADS
jgi:ketosteroid isomerase-like protein